MEVKDRHSPWVAIGVNANHAAIRQFNKSRFGRHRWILNEDDTDAQCRRSETSNLLPGIGGLVQRWLDQRRKPDVSSRPPATGLGLHTWQDWCVGTSEVWDEAEASRYDETSAEMFSPRVLGPTVDLLAELANGGKALEFAIGTGRVAVPLRERGVSVSGIDLSGPMVRQLRQKTSDEEIPVVVGDMATTRFPGSFSLVYLVFNSLANLQTQQEQVDCFANAARHLAPGGRFVVELWVPALRRLAPGETAVLSDFSEDHICIDTYDTTTQLCASHHYLHDEDGSYRSGVGHFRYAWPSECDLMARLAGLTLEMRFGDWDRSPFTSSSDKHVSVWRSPE
jgi:SAM-dependent methyltransferase